MLPAPGQADASLVKVVGPAMGARPSNFALLTRRLSACYPDQSSKGSSSPLQSRPENALTMEVIMMIDGYNSPSAGWMGSTIGFRGSIASCAGHNAAGGRTTVPTLIPDFGGRSVSSGRRLRI